jgi:hypothetical protein
MRVSVRVLCDLAVRGEATTPAGMVKIALGCVREIDELE